MVYRCAYVLAFVRMWLINVRFHISQGKEGGGDKLSLSAIIKSNLYLSGPANGSNYFVLTSEVLFYGLGKLALLALSKTRWSPAENISLPKGVVYPEASPQNLRYK